MMAYKKERVDLSFFYLRPKSVLTIFALRLFLRPCFVVGMPVAFAILRFADVIPKRRFQENPNVFMIPPIL